MRALSRCRDILVFICVLCINTASLSNTNTHIHTHTDTRANTYTYLHQEANYCSSCVTDSISYFSPLPCLIFVTVNEECLGGHFHCDTFKNASTTRDWSVCACVRAALRASLQFFKVLSQKHKHTRSSLIRSVQNLHQRITINCHLSQLRRCEGSKLAFRSRRA